MKKTNILKVFLTFLAISIFSFTLLFSRVPEVSADRLQEIQDQIEEYQKEISRLNTQANTLKNQISQFNAQINLTQLKIEETEEKIKLLGGRIDVLEISLQSLTEAFSSRANETYKMARLGDPLVLLVTSKNLSEAVTRFHYLQRIQEADRELLVRLQDAQNTYVAEKDDQEELQQQLHEQQKVLGAQKAAKAELLEQTENDEQKYQNLLAQARAQLAALRRFVTAQGGASILENQTRCNDWGCYYNQRDSLWGNIGLGGSSYSVAEYGCLVSSVSMLASHSGRNIKPSDIAVNPAAFVPGTGYLYHSFSVNGTNVSISTALRDQLDSLLSSGPVIAGLYSGPDHFIVILRKEGDNYIIHDPFVENGNEGLLTDNYSVSAISSLRLVQFN